MNEYDATDPMVGTDCCARWAAGVQQQLLRYDQILVSSSVLLYFGLCLQDTSYSSPSPCVVRLYLVGYSLLQCNSELNHVFAGEQFGTTVVWSNSVLAASNNYTAPQHCLPLPLRRFATCRSFFRQPIPSFSCPPPAYSPSITFCSVWNLSCRCATTLLLLLRCCCRSLLRQPIYSLSCPSEL